MTVGDEQPSHADDERVIRGLGLSKAASTNMKVHVLV